MPERKLLTTPAVVMVYAKVFEAVLRKNPEPKDKPQFTAAFLFDQAAYDDPLTKAILAEVQETAVAKWGASVFKDMVDEGRFENPFKRDIKSKGYPERFVRYFNSAANEGYPPGLFQREMDPATKRPKILTDKREIYDGVIVRTSVTCRAYGGPGTQYKPGVKLDFRNVQKLMDGERIQLGGNTGGTEFDALPPTEAADMSAGVLADMLE